MIVFFDGKLVPEAKAAISIRDHGFLYGDGVYETLRAYRGKPFLLYEHLRRLNNSLQGIRLTPPYSLIDIGHAVHQTIKANRHRESAIRLTITRGPGDYGFNPAYCKKPTIVITSTPFKGYPAAMYRKGMTLAVVSVRRNSPKSLPPSIKSTSCLNSILAKMESLDVHADEGLMLSHKNVISEGTVSNVFIIKKDVVMTPRLEEGLLSGVTRAWVCRLAQQSGYRLVEKSLSLTELARADEVFMTNTLMEIMPVSKIVFNHTGVPKLLMMGPYKSTSGFAGPVTQVLMRRFKASVA